MTVWHVGLFCKMRRNKLQGKLLHLIIDMYKKTKCVEESDRDVHSAQYSLIYMSMTFSQ